MDATTVHAPQPWVCAPWVCTHARRLMATPASGGDAGRRDYSTRTGIPGSELTPIEATSQSIDELSTRMQP